jgi:hypothetical protein
VFGRLTAAEAIKSAIGPKRPFGVAIRLSAYE